MKHGCYSPMKHKLFDDAETEESNFLVLRLEEYRERVLPCIGRFAEFIAEMCCCALLRLGDIRIQAEKNGVLELLTDLTH